MLNSFWLGDETGFVRGNLFVSRAVGQSSCAVTTTRFFYKKLGSGHSTKSFLISHEILSILVLKVSNWFLIF